MLAGKKILDGRYLRCTITHPIFGSIIKEYQLNVLCECCITRGARSSFVVELVPFRATGFETLTLTPLDRNSEDKRNRNYFRLIKL